MSEDLIFRSDEATKGGLQAVKKVEGILNLPVRVDAREAEFTTSDGRVVQTSDQAKTVLDDAVILEMEPGEPEPELPEGRYTFWMNFAKPGKPKAHQNTFYVKGFLKSAEELCKARGIPENDPNFGVRCLVNTRVVLERKTIPLFKRRPAPDQEPEEITGTNFVFTTEEGEAGIDINEYVKSLIIGKNKQAALRAILMDNRAKRHPEFREAINNDTIAQLLSMKVSDDGLFEEGTPDAVEDTESS